MPFFPGSWSAVIATALIGTLAYLFVYWIRLKEINRSRDPKDQLTLKELIEEDWGVVLKTVRSKENKGETKPTEQNSKAGLRRGSSSVNLKGLSKDRPVFKRMSSGSGATLRISMTIRWIISWIDPAAIGDSDGEGYSDGEQELRSSIRKACNIFLQSFVESKHA